MSVKNTLAPKVTSTLNGWNVYGSNNIQTVNRLNRLEKANPYLRRGAPVFTNGQVVIPANGVSLANGQINPVQGVSGYGNLAPNVISGQIGFSATPTSIVVYWDGTNGSKTFIVKRADGTNFPVPAGRLSIGNLTASTQYGFSISWRVNNPTALSFSVGDSGTPKIAVSPSASNAIMQAAIQAQQQFDAEAIYSGFVYFTTPATGTSSGAGTNQAGSVIGSLRVRGFAPS